ncbi:HutD family protein [Dyella sp. KRB-257]|uniref:HutD/Ves family protein n=1 Tax=Dyella sp. KRB-257 TaxID=3400915 RepID=UPI003BFDD6C9
MSAGRLLRADALVPVPWRNGLGITREIAVMPPGAGPEDFLWRVSLADVVGAAPFSRFPGVDRTIVLIDGVGFRMTLDGTQVHDLTTPCAPFAFPGEAEVAVALAACRTLLGRAASPAVRPLFPPLRRPMEPPWADETSKIRPRTADFSPRPAKPDRLLADGATRDFNLMLRRGRASGGVEVWRGSGRHVCPADVVLLYAVQGPIVTPAGTLAAGDSWLPGAPPAGDVALAAQALALIVRVHAAD